MRRHYLIEPYNGDYPPRELSHGLPGERGLPDPSSSRLPQFSYLYFDHRVDGWAGQCFLQFLSDAQWEKGQEIIFSLNRTLVAELFLIFHLLRVLFVKVLCGNELCKCDIQLWCGLLDSDACGNILLKHSSEMTMQENDK